MVDKHRSAAEVADKLVPSPAVRGCTEPPPDVLDELYAEFTS